jgi:hypothetical protein
MQARAQKRVQEVFVITDLSAEALQALVEHLQAE